MGFAPGMNKRQKSLVIELAIVVGATAIVVIGMVNLKDWVNRSEAVRAMEQLGRAIGQYRESNGSLPPQSYIENIKPSLEGYVRLGQLQYRGLWIDLESTGDDILAYTLKRYGSSFIDDGYVVLRLDGTVEWLVEEEFEAILAKQQSQHELRMLRSSPDEDSAWNSGFKR